MIKKEQNKLNSNVLICLSLAHLHLSVPMYFQDPKLSSSRNLPLSARVSLWEPCSPSISLPLALPTPHTHRHAPHCFVLLSFQEEWSRCLRNYSWLQGSPSLGQERSDCALGMLHVLSPHCLYSIQNIAKSCGRPRALYPEIQECPSRAGNFWVLGLGR